MTVLTCAHCGAPRDPSSSYCAFCRAPFASTGAPGAAPGIEPDIEAMIRKQNLIGAIKIYRERHETDLITAKNAVEDMKKRLGL